MLGYCTKIYRAKMNKLLKIIQGGYLVYNSSYYI